MRTLHFAMMGVMSVAVLAVALGATHFLPLTAEAQHGHGAEPQSHFEAVAGMLELTADQRQALAAPFQEAFAAMQELHRLHDAIAAQLTDAQRDKLREMVHERMGEAFSTHAHHMSDHDGGQH